LFLSFFFFFFQAEDGIRDKLVTGVQTCALPISHGSPTVRRPEPSISIWSMIAGDTSLIGQSLGSTSTSCSTPTRRPSSTRRCSRSEERRVGKECRYRGSPYH